MSEMAQDLIKREDVFRGIIKHSDSKVAAEDHLQKFVTAHFAYCLKQLDENQRLKILKELNRKTFGPSLSQNSHSTKKFKSQSFLAESAAKSEKSIEDQTVQELRDSLKELKNKVQEVKTVLKNKQFKQTALPFAIPKASTEQENDSKTKSLDKEKKKYPKNPAEPSKWSAEEH